MRNMGTLNTRFLNSKFTLINFGEQATHIPGKDDFHGRVNLSSGNEPKQRLEWP